MPKGNPIILNLQTYIKMSVKRIASRYAKSLLDLSVEQNKLDLVLGDIKSLQTALENRDLFLMLKSPIIKGDKKKQIFDVLFGDSFDTLTMGFMNIVTTKGRENILSEIVDEFVEQYKEKNNISTVKVTSATPLSEKDLNNIEAKLKASGATNKNIEMITAVNPDLLGGFVIEIGDKLYDSSLAYKLKMLKKEFTNA